MTANQQTKPVTRIYRGREGCRCGCRGTYFESNHRLFTSVLKQFDKALSEAAPSDVDTELGTYTNVDLERGRVITAYYD